jgi:sarcosine/dimethylglycine N-methyltransferase
MSQNTYSEAVNTAREYYNSTDADRFYYNIWGGEDIHIGLYGEPEEEIKMASRRTVQTMASCLEELGPKSRVLDLGAGFGGAARFLAKNFGCRVTALNLSPVQNERNRQMNREQKLDHLVEVVEASFEEVPYPDESFDYIWSQDAILHSGDRKKVMAEVKRLLKPGGQFVFTDPMAADNCPEGVLKPIYDRIHLETLGSPRFYKDTLEDLGMRFIEFKENTDHLVNHYSRVLQETESREKELGQAVSRDYIDRMKKGLKHWMDGGEKGYLAWGVFLFQKS